jgi:hypothetical protein
LPRGHSERLRRMCRHPFPGKLSRVCGHMSPEIHQSLGILSPDQLARLGEDLLEFSGLGDLTSWLAKEQRASPGVER